MSDFDHLLSMAGRIAGPRIWRIEKHNPFIHTYIIRTQCAVIVRSLGHSEPGCWRHRDLAIVVLNGYLHTVCLRPRGTGYTANLKCGFNRTGVGDAGSFPRVCIRE